MSEQRNDADFDRILRTWSRRRQSAKNLDQLKHRVLANLARSPSSNTDNMPSDSQPSTRGRKTRWPEVLYISAASVALVAAGWFVLTYKNFHSTDDAGPPTLSWFQDDELRKQAKLLREVDSLFENRLAWLAESNGRVSLEVSQIQPSENDRATCSEVAVRVVMLKRDTGTFQWIPIWSANVLARQEEVVRLAPESADLPAGSNMSFWTFVLKDGAIAVDSAFSLKDAAGQSTYSGLQRSGVPAEVHFLQDRGEEYKIYQTVARLDG
jgi:hypothetical protein